MEEGKGKDVKASAPRRTSRAARRREATPLAIFAPLIGPLAAKKRPGGRAGAVFMPFSARLGS